MLLDIKCSASSKYISGFHAKVKKKILYITTKSPIP